jgi:CyaY protein
MSENAFLAAAEAVLDQIESLLGTLADQTDLDLDLDRQGNVLRVDFEQGSPLVINIHEAAREIWVAARTGGFHYRLQADGQWVDTRNEDELFAALSRLVSEGSGQPVRLSARRD